VGAVCDHIILTTLGQLYKKNVLAIVMQIFTVCKTWTIVLSFKKKSFESNILLIDFITGHTESVISIY